MPNGPATELKQLEHMIGHWKGSGSAEIVVGAPAVPWTATVSSEWALGGHFLQSDSTIEFENIGTMRLREYVGWDAENQKFAQIQIGNSGSGNLVHPIVGNNGEVSWFSTNMDQGGVLVERVVNTFEEGKWDFSIQFLGASGGLIDGVSGTFEKVERVDPAPLHEVTALMPAQMMPGHASMSKLVRMVGEYEFEGEMLVPGADTLKIKGHDSVRALFDGSVLQVVSKGTADGMPGEYEAHGYHVWSPVKGCLESIFVSNMGEIGAWQAWLTDDQTLVSVFAGTQMGQPVAKRIALELDERGHMVAITGHACIGSEPPTQDFKGRYKRVD